MGHIRHHAVVVTSLDEGIEPFHAKAVEIFGGAVSAIVNSEVNGYRSFLVAPDGSKEGWEVSADGERRRHEFIAYLTQRRRDHPWDALDWVLIQYGDDLGEPARVVASDSSANAQADDESSN